MSQENLEIVQRLLEGSADEDTEGALEWLAPDAEMLGAVGGLEEGTVIRGREAVHKASSMDREVWSERRYDVQRLIDAGQQVVALVREHRRGKGSGVEVGAEIAIVYTLRSGRIVRIEPYMSQAAALEAVGLAE